MKNLVLAILTLAVTSFNTPENKFWVGKATFHTKEDVYVETINLIIAPTAEEAKSKLLAWCRREPRLKDAEIGTGYAKDNGTALYVEEVTDDTLIK